MKFLNLGCGHHYCVENGWVNLDFVSTGDSVLAHNLVQGIPFSDNTFALVYHSHVLEHFSKNDGINLLKECCRVLKSGGILRIAIPDLEQIARNYLYFLEKGIENPEDENIRADYTWMLLEMYDQTVRNYSGGEMGRYLFQDKILNEEFVYKRIGEEGKGLRNSYLKIKTNGTHEIKRERNLIKGFLRSVKQAAPLRKKKSVYEEIGRFRLQGEIHQWMYDRYSLTYILKQQGFGQVTVRDAFTSFLPDWKKFNLDGKDEVVRKPDSLFIEAIKK
jgi:predicted SAM-dependent methyltransferase